MLYLRDSILQALTTLTGVDEYVFNIFIFLITAFFFIIRNLLVQVTSTSVSYLVSSTWNQTAEDCVNIKYIYKYILVVYILVTTPLPSIALKVGDPPIRVGGWSKGEGIIITEIIYNYNQSLSLPALSYEHIKVLEAWCDIYFSIFFFIFILA